MSSNAAKVPMSNKKFVAIWAPVLGVVLVLAITANVLLGVFSNWVASQLGTGTYTITNSDATADWDTTYNEQDFATAEEATAAAEALVESIEAEGVVLLKNEAQALPLTGDGLKVTLLGRGAADPVYGGAGSGSTDTSKAVDVRAGLENAGLEVNGTVYDLLADYAAETPRTNIVMDKPAESIFNIGEMPAADYTDAAVASFADYNDAAVVVIGRAGGEGGDLATSMEGWDENYVAGQHQLELNLDEQQTIALAQEHFDTVIVVVNASTSMELGLVQDDSGVDAVLQVGSPGQSGFNAVGQVLTGAVNPSGRTVDIYSADFTQDPTFVNFGDFQYTGLDSPTGDGYLVQYEEGIYVGYRYYETAAVEGFLDYDQAVVYPFGYGLSYTSFDWDVTDVSLGEVDGEITVDVTVTNTGDVAGKDVVQLYYSAPYTPGGIEKSSVVLGAFEKTGLLAPGESQTLTLDLAVEDMASYDYKVERAYVLEAGDYQVTVQSDSHTVAAGVEPITYTVGETVVYSGENHRASDDVEVTNQFDDVSAAFTDTPEEGKILNLSRADFAGTFPTAPTAADLAASADVIAGFAAYDSAAASAASDAEMPTQGAEGDLGLIDMRGLDYDDPQWESLLDQITVAEMTNVLLNGAYNTGAINSIVKEVTGDFDGPAGFSSFISNTISGVAYPSEVVIGQTWNKDLAYEMGVSIGNEGLTLGANGWYAPAVNLHRSPFAGRNFEYYSEDAVVSGELAAQVVSGTASKGVYSFVKHFAMNDQEARRIDNGIATWANEQAIREIYLKPFEITLKDASSEIEYISDDEGTVSTRELGATAVMSSFNRIGSTWAGGSEALMDTVLRDEWGFRGIVITDFNLYGYMYPDQGIKAGSDLMLTFQPMKSLADTTSAEAVSNIREATHNILYAVANSNAMNGIASGAELDYTPPAWRYWQIAISAVVGILLALGTVLVVRRVRTHRELEAAEAAAPQDGAAPEAEEQQS
ncbi:glycoside hydrolase family 3 C-terminal domain-containing protein [Cellulomonas timonensis]|uniref:glycoside hydrolase family 3 C-terminal domain-containing protein n=1 Tax=Cellulomonas timonensis TaxID=1689271 RepID=UPI00083279A0|nr:glycoside hydrolase family 3 C-terminal domain-containing protein [Cellulomonas timonensis]